MAQGMAQGMLQPAGTPQSGRLSRVVLEDDAPTSLPPFIEADREQAVTDIGRASRFVPLKRKPGQTCDGPFALHLALRDGRMVFDIRCDDDTPVAAIGLALGPFRSLIKDYHLLVDSHIKAVQEGRMEHIQAVDMGRRGLHDEGAELLRTRLHGKIDIDFDTARRLFTLLCVLHQKVAAR
jgi:uncharacterized protein (UPF0262 family)